ncbi:MAG: ABC transporter substrate-binding protein [Candidatus Ratteibacteria bacterium]|jgi:putative ABC transport system substrate-binding protein
MSTKTEVGITLNKHTEFNWQIALVILLVITIGVFLSIHAKKRPRVYRVGIISGAEPFVNIADGFKTKMTGLGYLEGKNIIYDFKKMDGNPAEIEQVLNKFVADKLDLIFAFPSEPAVAAKAATRGTNIPVVFAMAGIDGNNLVESVRHPGGNITGVRFPGLESTVKRFEFLVEIVPRAKRIYLVYDKNYPNTATALAGLRPMAKTKGITLVEDPVTNLEEFRTAVRKRAEANPIGIDAILLMPDILNNLPEGFGTILEFANKHKIPIGGGMGLTADMGAMFSFVPDNIDQGMLAASLADKIFKGTPAGSIPVVTPESHLRLNYKVIQKLGLTATEGLLGMADEIIR